MTSDDDNQNKSPQSAGGEARALALTSDRRVQIARNAASMRWAGPRATHEGELRAFGIDCAVLEDGRRVLSRRGVGRALGSKHGGYQFRGGGEMPFFLSASYLKPFISEELATVVSKPVLYRSKSGGPLVHGIDATVLPMICEVWLKARDAGVLKLASQKRTAAQADTLLRGLAKLGIVALVDEATGYQEVRPRDALQRFLEMIVRKELAAWSKRFPDEFYENIYKLKGWPWPGMGKNRYSVVAHYTRDLIYERLAPGVLKELEAKSPKNEKGVRKNKLHQWLTDDVGHPMLAQHIHAVMMFQRLAINNGHGWARFYRMVDQVMPKKGQTLELPGIDPTPSPTEP